MVGVGRERNGHTSFIGAVVARVAVCVVEEEGAEQRWDAED